MWLLEDFNFFFNLKGNYIINKRCWVVSYEQKLEVQDILYCTGSSCFPSLQHCGVM